MRVSILLFALLCLHAGLLAQDKEVLFKRATKRSIHKVGFIVGIGINVLNIDRLNRRLADLQIGQVDNFLASRAISLYMGDDELAASLDVNLGTALENKPLHPSNTSLNLNAFSLSLSFYKLLLQTKRVNLLALLGFRYTDLTFEYNANTSSSAGFNVLMNNPVGNASTVRLQSNGNICVPLGVQFQYQLGKLPNLKAREFKIGFDAGYTYCVIANNWWEAGSAAIVRDMPETKPNNIFFNLTFSAFLAVNSKLNT